MESKFPYSSSLSQVNAAELGSLVESAQPVIVKLALIAATSEFAGLDQEALRNLRDWVDHAYVALVELCEIAAERVDVELEVPPDSSAPALPKNIT